jgi:DHA2 family methylenomycin A resistance protein-like MFS transporter
MGDLWGRRRILLLSLAGFIFCVPILIYFSPLSAPFFVAYILWAIIGAMIRTLAVTFLILKYEDRERIVALVIYSILFGAAFLLSPILTRTINEAVGLNAVFIVPVLLAAWAIFLVKKNILESHVSYDFWLMDAIALAAWTFGLCLIIFAGVLSGGLGWTHPLVLVSFGLGAAILLLVSWLSGHKIFGKREFKLRYDRRLGVSIFSGVVLILALYGISIQVYNFMNWVQNISPVLSVFGLAPILIGAIFSIRMARWSSQREIGQVISAGFTLIGLTAFLLSLLQPGVSYLALLPCLLLLGFGFILANTARLLLLSRAVPESLAATVQSIGSATAHMGSALGYSFMITLIEGFGVQAYVQTLASLGLSEMQVALRLSNLARASEEISVLAPVDGQAEIMTEIDYWIRMAYTAGLSQAMLVLSAVCLFSAAVVYLGLRRSKNISMYGSTEHANQKGT